LQCDPGIPEACDSGCSGGLPNNALEWIVDKGGLVSEADYPYSGRDGTCKLTDGLKIAAKVDNFSRVAVDEKQVRAAPLLAAILSKLVLNTFHGIKPSEYCKDLVTLLSFEILLPAFRPGPW
jgi:hypothetical protein